MHVALGGARRAVLHNPPFPYSGAAQRDFRSWVTLWLLMFIGCLVPAALNGYPAAFGDTLNYLAAARDLRPTHERAFGYGAFLRAAGGLASFWLPAAAQSALAATLAVRLLSLEAENWPTRRWPLLTAAFATVLLAGHLPWQASFVMPDVFTGILLLALLLLAEHWTPLQIWERVLIAATLVGAATAHLTHPPLLLGLAVAAGAVAVLLPAIAPARFAAASLLPVRRAAIIALAAAALGWGALAAANLVTYREAVSSRGSAVFLFARLQADADAPRILRPHCEAGAGFAICDHLDRLAADRPGADGFLWDWGGLALLPELGWVPGFYAEARSLNAILLPEAWRDWLSASARRTGGQLIDFRLGDGMDREGLGVLPEALPKQGMAETARAVGATRQAADRLAPLMPRQAAEGLATLGLLALVGFVVLGLRRNRPAVWWPALLFLVFWAGNAALIALAGEVHGRYGARLVWVAPLLAGVLALRAAGLRRA